ncbi:MAG: diacylglycerol kinase family lipid kinase [Flavobacteriaceae bacterium]|jgi:YegS/Rv2252/BmrU family lipid kinase|nr:diacylglycerol kinase family lipid kinase [Flavobacteriaceae bacterium]
MRYKNIHFIVNPISGKGKGEKVENRIRELFLEGNATIKVTGKKNDGFKFALESVNEGADLIVSCGGDGTFNEIASALVGKGIPLAIIPIGSGNGLSRHLRIPFHYEEALQLILGSGQVIKNIDCGKINDMYFFSNAGIGFDAETVNIYAHQKQRQLLGYIKCVMLSIFNYKAVKVSVVSEQEKFSGEVMMLNISNSNCMGYGFSIAPNASLEDGLFDVILIKKCSWFTFSWIGLGFLINKNLGRGKKIFNTEKLEVEVSVDYIQLDGEYAPLQSKLLNISILPKALPILVG